MKLWGKERVKKEVEGFRSSLGAFRGFRGLHGSGSFVLGFGVEGSGHVVRFEILRLRAGAEYAAGRILPRRSGLWLVSRSCCPHVSCIGQHVRKISTIHASEACSKELRACELLG